MARVVASALLAAHAVYNTLATQVPTCGSAGESYGTSPLNVACPNGNYYITAIQFANYGLTQGICGGTGASALAPQTVQVCHEDVTNTPYLQACLKQTSCSIYVDNGNPGWYDPCSGIYKQLTVQFQCTYCDPGTITTPLDAYTGYVANTVTWVASAQWSCAPGYYITSATPVTRTCNMNAGTWDNSNTPGIGCGACGVGYYCPGVPGSPAQQRIMCPAGTFALPTVPTLTSSACSGQCTAGYYCTAGSTSATQNPCGGVGFYCPAGSSAPIPVPAGSYAGPLTAAPDQRYQIIACPANLGCAGGVILPGVSFNSSVCSGTSPATATISQNQTNAVLFTTSVVTPGYSGGVVWATTTITPNGVNCIVPPTMLTWSTYGATLYGQLSVGAVPVDYTHCLQGFTLAYSVTRATDPTQFVTCSIAFTVSQNMQAPSITSCGPRSVVEKQLPGASVGAPVAGVNYNTGTSLRWFLQANPFYTVDTCSGQVYTLQVLSYKGMVAAANATQTLTLTLTNDGSALGYASISTTCAITLSVTQFVDPPVVVTPTLYTRDLQPIGTSAGLINVTDDNGLGVTDGNFSWAAMDPTDPTAFAINPATGNVSCTRVINTLAPGGQTSYSYSVRVTNSLGGFSVAPVTILVTQVPRPPVVYPQSLSVSEAAVALSTLSPALTASSAQGYNLSYSIAPTDTFGCYAATGVVFVQPGAVLNFQSRPVYVLVLQVLDSMGSLSTSNLTVTLLEVNKPPAFPQGAVFNLTVAVGQQPTSIAYVATSNVKASDPNLEQTHVYTPLSWTPASGAALFVLDPVLATVSLAPTLPAGAATLAFDWTAVPSLPRPRTYEASIMCTDSGIPPMNATATLWIQVINIPPQLAAAVTWTGLLASATAGAAVGTVPATSAYAPAGLSYAIATNAQTPLGDVAFAVNAAGAVTVSGNPRWDYNAQPSLSILVNVTDTGPVTIGTGTVPTYTLSNITVRLQHVNRPPGWVPTPWAMYFYAPASVAGTVGSPLTGYVYDPDVILHIGENFTFAITAGNTGTTFGIDAYSGQLSVINAGTAAISLPGPGFFNLTVSVTDAGIDGPHYTAIGYVYVNVTANGLPPQLNYTVLSIPELVPVGTFVGTVVAIEPDLTRKVYYSLAPRGANVNRLFPFNVTTLARAGTPNVANISVVDAPGPVDYNAFPAYNCTLTACNDNPAAPLCVSAPLDIVVGHVPTAPFFSPNTATAWPWLSTPSSAVFYLSTFEHSPHSQLIGPVPVAGSSRDALHVLHYSWPVGSFGYNNSVVFSIDQLTGNVSINPTNTLNLDVNTQISYYLTAQVQDMTTLLTDTARIVINVVDVNDPAVFSGAPSFSFEAQPGPYAADNATLLPRYTFNCSEAAAPGAVLGFVRAIDEDRMNLLWGQTNYALVSGPDSAANFAIDAKTGRLTVAPGAALNFWDQTSYTFNVTCSDGLASIGSTPITVAQPVTIQLLQVNTVAVSGFYVASSVAPALAINASGSPYAASLPLTQVLYATTGAVRVYITGSGFGPTAHRQGLVPVSYAISATYASLVSGPFTATSCQVEALNTLVSCVVAAGAGVNLMWSVTVTVSNGSSPGAWTSSPSTATTSYFPPTITSVTTVGAMTVIGQSLPTAGGTAITVTATNVGPTGTAATLYYGSAALGSLVAFSTAPCAWVITQSTVSCVAAPGVGTNLSFTLVVAGQSSPAFAATLVGYAPPSIAGVVATPALLDTVGATGGQTFTVTGSNFGPLPTLYPAVAAAMPLTVTYSQNFASLTVFSAPSCTMTAVDTGVTCNPADGVGNALQVIITVGGQSSLPSLATIAYQPPTIVNVSGPALADTLGGDSIVLSGWQFGPLTPTDLAGDALPGFLQPVAAYGHYPAGGPAAPMNFTATACRVSVPSVQGVSLGQMRCTTAPGCGANLVWRVTIGGQMSPIFSAQTTTYHPPIVASYSGIGSDYTGAGTALTQGGQQVVIDGKSFGPATCPINLVTYGADFNSTQFTAYNCFMSTPQTDITCLTEVGAGTGLKWKVTIDGQLSVTPTTDYGPPQVNAGGFTGTGATNANADGGDPVVVSGTYFSVPAFLQSVSYGPSGTEYNVFPGSLALTAAYPPCALTVNHTQLTCTTLPGTGRANQWRIQVGGQSVVTSAPLTTSYAAPTIASITPNHLPTGGGVVHINGTNFGVLAGASLVVLLNSGSAIARPTDAQLQAHFTNVYAGVAGVAYVTQWMASLKSLLPSATYTYGRGVNGLDVAIPEGFGYFREVIVVAGGVPSYFGGAFGFSTGAVLTGTPTWAGLPTLSYDAPAITNIAPDFVYVNYSAGQLRVQVDGTSFCNTNAYTGCGTVALTVVPTVVGNPPTSQLPFGTVLPTTVMYPPPWNTTLATPPAGAPVQWSDSALAFWVQQPPVNTNLSLVVTVNGVASPPAYFSKPVPSINSLSGQDTQTNWDTLGGQIYYINGVTDVANDIEFGTLAITIGASPPRNCPLNATVIDNGRAFSDPLVSFRISCVLPPGVGVGVLNPVTIVSSAGQSSLASGLQIQYAPPVINSEVIITPFLPPAYAGAAAAPSSRLLASPGNPGPVPTLGAIITVSGRYFGLNASGTPLLVAGPAGYMLPCALISRSDSLLVAQLPPGDGLNNQIVFSVGDQNNTAVTFDYAAPTVAATVPAVGPGIGGTSISVFGYNFGISGQLTALPGAQPPKPMPWVAIGSVSGPGVYSNCTITSPLPALNHSALNCTLPRGQGAQLPVTLWVNGQLSLAPAPTFSYLPPAVASIAPAHGPTSGRTPGVYNAATGVTSLGNRIVACITGTNLGRSGVISFNATAASGPLTSLVVVNNNDVLPTAAFTYLLQTAAGGRAGAVPGMSLSDAQIAALWPSAAPPPPTGANGTNASAPVSGVLPLSTATYALGVQSAPLVGRMWNETQVWFLLPPGLGANLQVNVSADQPGSSAAVFSYDPPTISLVINANFQQKENGCQVEYNVPSPVGFMARQRNVTARNMTVWPGCYPTAGGFQLMLVGDGFGDPKALGTAQYLNNFGVTVGGVPCDVLVYTTVSQVTSDYNHLFCSVRPGYGSNLPVLAEAGGRYSAVTNVSLFSFDPPSISYFDPNNPDALGIPQLGIAGANFGSQPTPTTLLINTLPCAPPASGPIWQATDFLYCVPQADVVGTKNVTLYIANSTFPAQVLDVEEQLVYTCKTNFYGLEGEVCLPCPVGASCPGDERFVDLVNATAGFWRENATLPSSDVATFCAPQRIITRAYPGGPGCPVMQPCSPSSACLGNNTCAYGYADARCVDCLPGLFYRVNGACVKCPDNLYLLYAGLAVLLLLVGLAGYFLARKNVNLAIIAIGVDYFQVVSMFAKANIKWPPVLTGLFTWLSVFNLNLDIVAPECLNPGITYEQKWFFIEGLPLLLSLVFTGVFCVRILYKLACTTKRGPRLFSHLPTLISTVTVVWRVLFMYLTRTSFDVMTCLPTTPPQFRNNSDPNNPSDPILYMGGMINYPCGTGWNLILMPLGIGTLCLYSVACPIAVGWWLRRNREAVKYDQLLRCKGIGNDKLTNPKYYRFRKTWSKLYQNYKPGKVYWELFIVARKFLIALTSLMFATVGSFQLAVCLLVLFIAFVLHTQNLPYITHDNRGKVLEEHTAKALAGDRLHSIMEAEMRAVDKKNTRKRTRQNVFQNIVASKTKDSSAMLFVWIFDANTVEAILLASAILVNLSGIMFDSAEFTGGNYYINQGLYTGLAVVAVLIISLTIVYYVTTIILELTVLFCPDSLGPVLATLAVCFKSFGNKKAKELAIKAAQAKGKAVGDGAVTGSDMQVNPFMMKASLKSTDPVMTAAGIVDAKQVELVDAPTEAMWAAVKVSYGRLVGMTNGLQAEIRDLKRDAEDGLAGPSSADGGFGGGGGSGVGRSRTQFKPVVREAGADGGGGGGFAQNPLAAAAGGRRRVGPTASPGGFGNGAGNGAGNGGAAGGDARLSGFANKGLRLKAGGTTRRGGTQKARDSVSAGDGEEEDGPAAAAAAAVEEVEVVAVVAAGAATAGVDGSSSSTRRRAGPTDDESKAGPGGANALAPTPVASSDL